MKTNKIQQNKKALLAAMEKSLGVVTTACKAVGIDRTTFYKYLNEDPDFATAVAELENVALDFAESSLMKQIQEGQTAATIFYLKTKGKARGYVERSEIDHTTKGEAIQIPLIHWVDNEQDTADQD
jgi:CRP-like cAMP-binding protein